MKIASLIAVLCFSGQLFGIGEGFIIEDSRPEREERQRPFREDDETYIERPSRFTEHKEGIAPKPIEEPARDERKTRIDTTRQYYDNERSPHLEKIPPNLLEKQ